MSQRIKSSSPGVKGVTSRADELRRARSRSEGNARSAPHADAFGRDSKRTAGSPALGAGPAARPGFSGGGLPASDLGSVLRRAQTAIEAVAGAPRPTTPEELVATYSSLGRACAEAEACLLSALDAMDPATGGGAAHPPEPYRELKEQAFSLLRRAGAVFAALEPAFGAIVHGGRGWPSQPVTVSPDRGDGRPLVHYENTFKRPTPLSLDERRAEYEKRVEKFERAGGRFEDIIAAAPGVLEELPAGLRHDYVLSAEGTLRLYPNENDDSASGAPKAGHSLLMVGGREFKDGRAVMAGELWVLRDTAGDVEAVLVANNSGHFKPAFADLDNVLPALEELGIPKEKVVLFGGPNNLAAIFREMTEKNGLGDLSSRLPPHPRELLAELQERPSGAAELWR